MANSAATLATAPAALAEADPDQGLLAAVAAGDVASLGLLFDRHGQACHRCAFRITADRQRADEAVVAVFLELWRQPPSGVAGAGLTASWLLQRTTAHCGGGSDSSLRQRPVR